MRATYEGLGATIIDASGPLTEVVDRVLEAVEGTPARPRPEPQP